MDELDDRQLLQEYVASASNDAFAKLVRRYVNLVYAAARRQCRGNAHLAEDVTQAVFILLSRKAPSILNAAALPAWLISTTRFTANNAVNMERRLRHRERNAAAMSRESGHETTAVDSDALTSLLDEGLTKLGTTDRGAVTMRFFQGRSFRDVGAALGMSDEAAQKRVRRAIEKLRTFFARRGVTMDPPALAGRLSREATQLAPAALPAVVLATVTNGMTAGAAGGSVAAYALAEVTAKGMAAAASAKAVVVVAASVVLIASVGAAVYAAHSGWRGTKASAAPAAVATTRMASSPLVLVNNARAAERPPQAESAVFPNALIAPIGATNNAPYSFGDDAAVKRQPDSAPAAFMASSGRSLMPGMRGWAAPSLAWRGKRVEVSVHLRTQDVRETTGLNVIVWGPQNQLLASDMDGGPLRIAGTNEWTRMASVLDVPEEAQRIEFGIGLWGAGRVWLDSFTMQVVSDTAPVTSDTLWHLSTQFTAQYRLVNDPSQPRNGHATVCLHSTDAAGAAARGGDWAKLTRIERAMDALRGKRVRIGAMIKSDNLTGGAGVFANAGQFDAQRRYTQKESRHYLPVQGTLDWMQYATTLAVPGEASMLEYGVRLEGTGTLWIDEITVDVLP